MTRSSWWGVPPRLTPPPTMGWTEDCCQHDVWMLSILLRKWSSVWMSSIRRTKWSRLSTIPSLPAASEPHKDFWRRPFPFLQGADWINEHFSDSCSPTLPPQAVELRLSMVWFGYPFSCVACHFLWTCTGPSVAMIHQHRAAKDRDGWGKDFFYFFLHDWKPPNAQKCSLLDVLLSVWLSATSTKIYIAGNWYSILPIPSVSVPAHIKTSPRQGQWQRSQIAMSTPLTASNSWPGTGVQQFWPGTVVQQSWPGTIVQQSWPGTVLQQSWTGTAHGRSPDLVQWYDCPDLVQWYDSPDLVQ